jgi:hypothetical protein
MQLQFKDIRGHYYECRRDLVMRPEIHDAIAEAVARDFGAWCKANPAEADAICDLIINQQREVRAAS